MNLIIIKQFKMKNILIGFTIVTTTLSACNNNNKTGEAKQNDLTNTSNYQQAVNDTSGRQTVVASTATEFPKELIAAYFQLKNALAKDNGKDAAAAGNDIVSILKQPKFSEETKINADLKDDIRENAEHIGANANKIEHQREHFVMLSKDIIDLIKTVGNGGQTLYKDFCPMANDGKGALWISEIKEIKNPYLGKKMLNCGSVKEVIN